ncbi:MULTISPECIES: hypothetical protein [Brevibacillus]|uniref:hypothetical protein n=1 Tax=Brevibacillus TaxID=55080 RepID=UPI0036335317
MFTSWKAERTDLKARRATLEAKYENMIAELASAADLQSIEDEMAQLDARLMQIDKTLSVVKRGRSQKLLELIPGVKVHREREKERIQQEFDEQLRCLIKMKAEYLLELRRLAQINASKP